MLKRIIITFFFASVSSLAFAAAGGHEEYLLQGFMSKAMQDFLFKTFNFAILLFLLHKFARPAIANMLSSAAKNAKASMEAAESKLKDAEAKLAGYQQKLAALEKDMAKMQADAIASIEEEKLKMIEDAKVTAEKIEQQTQMRIEQDVLQAKAEVRSYLVDESIKLAEKLIAEKVDSKEQKALISDYAKVIQEIA